LGRPVDHHARSDRTRGGRDSQLGPVRLRPPRVRFRPLPLRTRCRRGITALQPRRTLSHRGHRLQRRVLLGGTSFRPRRASRGHDGHRRVARPCVAVGLDRPTSRRIVAPHPVPPDVVGQRSARSSPPGARRRPASSDRPGAARWPRSSRSPWDRRPRGRTSVRGAAPGDSGCYVGRDPFFLGPRCRRSREVGPWSRTLLVCPWPRQEIEDGQPTRTTWGRGR